MVGKGWNLLYILIGLVGGFALGWGFYAASVGDLTGVTMMAPITLIMLLLIGIVIVAGIRQRRRVSAH